VLALALLAVGCGGGEYVHVDAIPAAPWDHAIIPPRNPDVPAEWAEGKVTEVSPDGKTITVALMRGEVSGGESIAIFHKPAIDPGPHYLADEVREGRAARGKIVDLGKKSFRAEIIGSTWQAPVVPGDRVVIRAP
jgi:hypothetical protein